ncbi:hypothetical protein MACH09_23130 [Vibrio sp. MACH09]|uniref:DUF1127 domain-containing protein n=1 Tax=unclassified Vibrio TaxID=2614977 RepID=UPI0014938B8A|nr:MULTISPECIES: DUF1127 domain-containing protein [unclassified Vibrio]NOI64769.1 DUF1127 domain-containing protein [Vibrio sp. 99-8-1]GLO61805.1 hypothetical protein MACH09_23130 [Vibrio sp. MACH09]
MSHSIYLKVAVLFVKADLRREEKKWQSAIRRSKYDIPWQNTHLLKDIGLESDGRVMGYTEPENLVVERRMRHLRRVFRSRLVT